MKLGFIGTGNIVSDVIIGICNSKISFKRITISPRNKKKAKVLKKKFKKIVIAKDNQEVIDNSDWIFLGVLPEVGHPNHGLGHLTGGQTGCYRADR